MSKRACVLWTGGKDSALAFHEAKMAGYEITCLATFAPPEAKFLAHPLSVMKLQAEAIGLPHIVKIASDPHEESYERSIRELKEEFGLDVLVTGDIDLVDGLPNWIRERARGIGIDVLTPLWGRDRESILQQLINEKFNVIFSLVKKPWLRRNWIGRRIDPDTIEELKVLSRSSGLDICGENGEYHTLVLDAPYFKMPLSIDPYLTVREGSMSYLTLTDQAI